jgi:isopenicillin N synthase-like dioxygenase
MALLSVPVIDVSPFLARDPGGSRKVANSINPVCEDIRLLVVTVNRVDSALADSVFAEPRSFFDAPVEEKVAVKQEGDNVPRGYSRLATESVSYSRLKWLPRVFRKSFSIGPLKVADEYHRRPGSAVVFAENRWPQRRGRFRQVYSSTIA